MTLQDASRSEPSQAARDAEETIKAAARDVLGQEPIGLERLSGGMNNVLYSFWHAGTRLVGKLYFRHPSDPRDRLSTEFTVLRLLWQRGIRCIPEPVAASQEHGVGFYGFVDGSRCSRGDLQRQDVEDYLLFTRHMWDLSASVAVGAVPKASDAAFSLTDRLKSVAARMEWVKNAVGPGYVEARRFLELDLAPVLERLGVWAHSTAQSAGISLDETIPVGDRALSQGDIGFHNCLRTGEGLVFHDFEYAGWDDIAQVAVQICLAPAVPVPEEMHSWLLCELLGDVSDEFLALRVQVNYPLLAVKWSLIMLNEFVEVGRERRVFAGAPVPERLASQVARAEEMLTIVVAAMGPEAAVARLPVRKRKS